MRSVHITLKRSRDPEAHIVLIFKLHGSSKMVSCSEEVPSDLKQGCLLFSSWMYTAYQKCSQTTVVLRNNNIRFREIEKLFSETASMVSEAWTFYVVFDAVCSNKSR